MEASLPVARMRAAVAPIICVGLTALGVLARPAGGQADGTPIARLEAGMLNASDPFDVTMAFGGALGWQLSRSNALLVRYVRQSQNRNSVADIGSKARGLLTANWEHAFGPSAQYHQQALIRVGVGALFRPLLATAPLVNASLELRYTVHPHVAFVGSLEDDVGRLPRQDFQFCATDASGNPVCQVYTSGAKVQHNFGFLVAIEWRP